MNDIPREKLRYIITQHGRAICDDPKRCEALLRDLCPQCKREINVLMGALKERVPKELMNGNLDTMPKEVIFARLVKRLYDNTGFEEKFCQWSVESWAVALGVTFEIPPVSPLQKGGDANPSLQKGKNTSPPFVKGDSGGFSTKTPKYRLRSQPQTLSDEDIRTMIKKHNFFCKKYNWTEKWHNEFGNFKNNFKDNGDDTITDHVTGLMWQKSGSDNYMSHNDSRKYINGLNRQKFAGYNDWHIPTIEELASLLKPEKQSNDIYIDSIFDEKQRWCWSADRRASDRAWNVDFNDGSIDWNGTHFYVRTVRNLTI